MLPFFLYLVTGLATGAQLLWIILWGVWGRPTQTVEVAACYAALGLLLAAYVALVSVRMGAWLAMACVAVQLAFYGPAIGQTLAALLNPPANLKPGPLWLALLVFIPALLTVAAGAHAVAAGPLRRAGPEWLFPTRASARAGLIVSGGTLAVVAGAVILSVFFLGVESAVEHEMRWSYSGRQGDRGAREVILVYVKSPFYYERFFSDELGEYLESTSSDTVRVIFRVTRDFGKVRGYGIERVGQWPHADRGWSGGGSGCGGDLPPCVGGAVPRQSPWDAPQ